MANEFVIKNGYFSQGNSNVTGSLQVTGSAGVAGSVSITQDVTASKALFSSSNGDQLTVIGSGSTVAQIYGSQGNLLIVNDTFSGSLFTVTNISGYPILDITSDYYTSSINTIGFLNHTGSLVISGAVYFPTLKTASVSHIVMYNTSSGQLYFTASSAVGGGGSSTFNSTSSIIGNGALTTWTINHGFNTLNLHITVYSSSGTYENVYPDIRRINANTASIVFANPPLTGQYTVYISQ